MTTNKPLVSIITVNYNGKKFLKECFQSVFNLNYPKGKLEVMMVDNCSQDDSVDFVKEHFPKVKLIKNAVNNYCRANNLGIKQARGTYIALINNDIQVDKNWLARLVEVIADDTSIGAVTSKVLFPDGKLQGAGHYELPDFYWSDRGFKEDEKSQYEQIEEVSSVSHCATLYRKQCFDDLGLLDEDFNMYMEDVDMSIRAKKKGWRLFFVPESTVEHSFHGSADENLVNFYCERNRLLLMAKHYPQKLADALFGRGYFTALNNKSELIKLLPDIMAKLIQQHDSKLVSSLLPDIFSSLNKILNLEKDYLIKQVDGLRHQKEAEVSALQEKVKQLHNLLLQKEKQQIELAKQQKDIEYKDKELLHKDSEINNLKEKISQNLILFSQKDLQLQSLLQQVQEKQKQFELKDLKLEQKFKDLADKEVEIARLKEKISHNLQLLTQRDLQLQNLLQQIQQKQKQLELKDIELQQKQNTLEQKELAIASLRAKMGQTLNLISRKEHQLSQKDRELSDYLQELKAKERQFSQKNTELEQTRKGIEQKSQQIQHLDKEIQKIYSSETYKFIARPMWKTLDLFKLLSRPFSSSRTNLLKSDKLCLGMFSAESNRAQCGAANRYFLKLTNNTSFEQSVKVVIDIYSYDDIGPNKHYGYFSKELICNANSSTELNIEYNWLDLARFYLPDACLQPDDFWKGNLDTAQFYSIKALLYYQQKDPVDELELLQRLNK